MKKVRINIIITIIAGINLLFSNMELAHSVDITTNGQMSITECKSNCLTLKIPNYINTNTIQFIDQNKKDIYIYSDYSLNQGITINNSNENSGFKLDCQASNASNINSTKNIPYTQIGILSFNNSSQHSIDTNNNTAIFSRIDPVVNNKTNEPFNQNTLYEKINNQSDISDYYTYFTGNSDNSNIINIITTTGQNQNYFGNYKFGISIIYKLPQNALKEYSLSNGHYNTTLTFTLTSL